MTIEIREETSEDIAAIREVNLRAFGQPLEARRVDVLRAHGASLLSLVAILNGQIVGHILYSPASIGTVTGVALGPMAVVPEHQRQGIGSRLVEEGNGRLRVAGHPFIIVLGHPRFYPRFGFERASTYRVTCKWSVPDDVFMLLALRSDRLPHAGGRADYREEFSLVT